MIDPEGDSGEVRTTGGGKMMSLVDKDLLASTLTYIRDIYIKSNLTGLAAKALLIAWGNVDEVDRLNQHQHKSKVKDTNLEQTKELESQEHELLDGCWEGFCLERD